LVLSSRKEQIVRHGKANLSVILGVAENGLAPIGRQPGMTEAARVADCLKPFDARLMKKYPVSTRVNRAENDDQECAREIQIVSNAPTLF
jgi:hypothetical protein